MRAFLISNVARLFLFAVIPIVGGCGMIYLSPPADEHPLDIAFEPDGTAILSTSRGNLLATDNQGATWNRVSFFDQVANYISGSIDELFITPDGTILGNYTAPAGRRFLSIAPNHSIAVSCDGGSSFDLVNHPSNSDYYEYYFVEQAEAFPLVLTPDGQLYELTTRGSCPDSLRELGVPIPVGSGDSAVACGDKLYQAGSSRVFGSVDRGADWILEWDFFSYGRVHLACEGQEVWAYHDTSGIVMKLDSVSGGFDQLGSFNSDGNYHLKTVVRDGFLYVAGINGRVKVFGMAMDGSIQGFPSPQIADYDEYFVDFEIGPDGVFWIATNLALYHDDPDSKWTKVWP